MIYLKRYLLFIFCTASLVARSQPVRDAAVDKEYNRYLAKMSDGKLGSADSVACIKFIYSLQNKGQRLAQNEQAFNKALDYTNKAIACWQAMKDSIHEADVRRFRGTLLARLQHFPEAKAEIDTADFYYRKGRHDPGIARTQYDRAFIYVLQHKPDSAIYFASIPLYFWKKKGNPARILEIQNVIQFAWIQLKEYEEAVNFQVSSDSLAALKDMHWQQVLDHYYVSQLLYLQQGKKAAAARYKKMFTDTQAILRADDVKALSIFEIVKPD
jgi:hypothetical protein